MPIVTAQAREMSNGDVVTEFIDTTGTTVITWKYPKTQNKLIVKNEGNANITATVGTITKVITPGQTWEQGGVSFTSCTTQSASGLQQFKIRTIATTGKPEKLAAKDRKKKPIAIATRCSVNHGGTTAVGTVTGDTFRWNHVMRTKATEIQLVFANFYANTTTESSNANAITIAVTLEYNGQFTRLHFNGSRQKTIDQGGIAISDPIEFPIPKDATFYTRIFLSVPLAGDTYPQGMTLNSTFGDGKGAGDLTLATGAIASSTEAGFGPVAIIGVPVEDDAVAVALIGDSIVANAAGDGWPVKLVKNDYGYSILSRPSTQVNSMFSNSANAYRMRLLRFFTHAIVNYGTNDFNNAVTFDTQSGLIEDMWSYLRNAGLEVYQGTVLPRSTGDWTTVPGQTTVTSNSYNAKRLSFNRNLRGGQYPVKVIDVAAQMEYGKDTGVWNPSYTIDGIHPVGTAEDAAVLNLSLGLN